MGFDSPVAAVAGADRAIGAPGSQLVLALLWQVVLVVGGGLVMGVVLAWVVLRGDVGGIGAGLDPSAVVVTAAAVLGLSLLASLASARRVLAIDPASAVQGDGGGR